MEQRPFSLILVSWFILQMLQTGHDDDHGESGTCLLYTSTKSAQSLMIAPALIAVIVPVVVGLILGVNGVAGLLAGNTVTGFVLAIMMANSRCV